MKPAAEQGMPAGHQSQPHCVPSPVLLCPCPIVSYSQPHCVPSTPSPTVSHPQPLLCPIMSHPQPHFVLFPLCPLPIPTLSHSQCVQSPVCIVSQSQAWAYSYTIQAPSTRLGHNMYQAYYVPVQVSGLHNDTGTQYVPGLFNYVPVPVLQLHNPGLHNETGTQCIPGLSCPISQSHLGVTQ